jgi:cell division protein FtsB
MRTQFDLRPADLIEKEDKKRSFNPIRLVVILLFLLFLGSTGFYFMKTVFAVLDLRDSVESKQSEVSRLEASRGALDAEIKRLQQREKMFTDTLKIMQDDLPTLELFEALETCADEGMRIFDLRYAAPQVVLNARADTEEQITLFRIELENSGVFSRVSMPTSRLDEKTRKVLFTLNLTLLPIGQISNSAARQGGVEKR